MDKRVKQGMKCSMYGKKGGRLVWLVEGWEVEDFFSGAHWHGKGENGALAVQ